MIKKLWNDFNNWIDPKFGVHILWIFPLFYIILVFEFLIDMLYNTFKRIKNLVQKRDIKDLKKLSGIK